ncbi:ABC transporter ATP-binding protein/permease [Planktomarina temperata]|nr:ABC transporter ATP-binding protein/permease [Planktomarina temperata]
MSIFKKFWEILDPSQRSKAAFLLIITIIGAALEAAGVGLVVPFVSIIVSDNFVLPAFLTKFWPKLASLTRSELVVGSVITFLGFYLIKNVFLLWLAARQANYYYSIQEIISVRLFKSYLNKKYAFHLQHNSSKLVSNTITESAQFSQGFTSAILLLLNDFLIIILILVVLFLIEPIGAIISLIIFGSMSSILFLFSKVKSASWGEARQSKERERVQWAQQGFNGMKDIKLYGREAFFIKQYREATRISLMAGRNQTILQQTPKIFLEFVAVMALCILITFLLLYGDRTEIFALVSVFSAAAFKLLPTASRLVQSFQAIIFNHPVVSLMHTELVEQRHYSNSSINSSDPRLSFKKNITLSNLTFRYQGVDKPSLEAVELNLGIGKMIGIIGPSGAGKSTLIDCILGLVHPTTGTINIDGEIITDANVVGWQKNIGYVSQAIYLLDLPLRENIAFGVSLSNIDEEKLQDAIRKSQLTDFVMSLPDGLDTLVGERGVRLSGGQRQRIGIARALYNDPPVLVLDEATSALDEKTESEVMAEILELRDGKTIIVIAHRLSTIKHCDYIYRLDKGMVIAHGDPSEMLGV